MKEKLLISIPSVWALRNFIYSGFFVVAKNEFDISFLVPANTGIERKIKSLNLDVISYPLISASRFERLLTKISLVHTLEKDPELKSKLFVRFLKNRDFKNKLKYKLAFFGSKIFSSNFIFKLLCKYSVDKSFVPTLNLIKEGGVKTIMATLIVAKYETKLFFQLYNRGFFLIDFVNSFDNTTSRGFLPFRIFNSHMVWNKKMKDELNQIYGIPEKSIAITGTPQFDILKESASIALGLNDHLYPIVENNENYILYCAGHISLLPFEVDLVASIFKELELNEKFSTYKMIIRFHPFDDFTRWERGKFNPGKVFFDIPWTQDTENPYLSVPDEHSFYRHARLIKNSKLVLNIASTSSLDACVINKPVANINYGLTKEDKNLIDNYLNSEHFKPIVDSGAVPNIDNCEYLFTLIESEELNSDKYVNLRRDLASNYCGYQNEQTASIRIIKTICEYEK